MVHNLAFSYRMSQPSSQLSFLCFFLFFFSFLNFFHVTYARQPYLNRNPPNIDPPSDPYFASQWFLHSEGPWDTQLESLWTLLRTTACLQKEADSTVSKEAMAHHKKTLLRQQPQYFLPTRSSKKQLDHSSHSVLHTPQNRSGRYYIWNIITDNIIDTTRNSSARIMHMIKSLYSIGDDKTIEGQEETVPSMFTTAKQTSAPFNRRLPIVAVIDTGCDLGHFELIDAVWRNEAETNCFDGIDNDGNGFIDDCFGWNFLENEPIQELVPAIPPRWSLEHGTEAAGVIASAPHNLHGIAGACLGRCQIMCLRAVPGVESLHDAAATEAAVVRAFRYAVQMGADITSNSYGSRDGKFTQLQKEIDQRSLEGRGHLFIVAAGNNGKDLDIAQQTADTNEGSGAMHDSSGQRKPFQPAAFSSKANSVIVVGASNRDGSKAVFSNFGANTVDLFAPGVLIATTKSGGDFDFGSGTSLSAPIVAGAAALLWSLNPDLTAIELKHALVDSAEPSSSLKDKCISGGTLNAWRAWNRMMLL